jgi:hypothetical protein
VTADAELKLIIPAPAPKRGEVILIERPGARDIRMRHERLAQSGWDPGPGWLLLHGEILEGLPNTHGWQIQTLCARPIRRGVYRMAGRPWRRTP